MLLVRYERVNDGKCRMSSFLLFTQAPLKGRSFLWFIMVTGCGGCSGQMSVCVCLRVMAVEMFRPGC